VPQPARHAAAAKSGPWLRIASRSPPASVRTAFSANDAVGVGQPDCDEVQPLPDVRCAEARSAGICRSAGVTRTFQVSEYSVEPAKSVRARNLLSKDD
jgi:hypothetical protein